MSRLLLLTFLAITPESKSLSRKNDMKQLHIEEPMNIRPSRPDARYLCPAVPEAFASEHADCQFRTWHWSFAVVCGNAVRDRQEPAAFLDCMQQLAVPGELSGKYWSARHRQATDQHFNYSSPKEGMDLQLRLLPHWKHNVYCLWIFHVFHNMILFPFSIQYLIVSSSNNAEVHF